MLYVENWPLKHKCICDITYVQGLATVDDENPVHFGDFYYDIELKNRYQKFPVHNGTENYVQYVHFKFLTNHGNEFYTCVYR